MTAAPFVGRGLAPADHVGLPLRQVLCTGLTGPGRNGWIRSLRGMYDIFAGTPLPGCPRTTVPGGPYKNPEPLM